MHIQDTHQSEHSTDSSGALHPQFPDSRNRSDQQVPSPIRSTNGDTHHLERRDSLQNVYNNPIHREIMEKLKHDNRSNPPQHNRDMNVSPIQRSNSLGSHEQLMATRYEADRRRVLADAAAFQAAALKQFKFPNGGVYGGLPAPAADILHSREAMFPFGGRGGGGVDNFMSRMSYMQDQSNSQQQTPNGGGNSSGRSSHSPPSDESEEIDAIGDDLSPHGSAQWTYEEQFKQLYEMGNEPERKQFLDDLFAFMQKKGSPVNRIPIMAKQTLDIFQLFRLVVAKGGLVEVINKKLWREITKGLNLPSSITSAAFTLRTQYMKYLYPYECEKHNFSSPAELQAAIDGNRREGRRPGYGYDLPPGGLPMSFYGGQSMSNTPFFNPSLLSNPMMNMLTSPMGPSLMNGGGGLPPHMPTPRLSNPTLSGIHPMSVDKDENHISPPNGALHSTSPRESAFTSTRLALHDSDSLNRGYEREPKRMRRDDSPARSIDGHTTRRDSGQTDVSEPVSERSSTSQRSNTSHNKSPNTSKTSIGSTNIKITNSKDGQSGESQLVITMDINGTMYQGVLFAQPRSDTEQ